LAALVQVPYIITAVKMGQGIGLGMNVAFALLALAGYTFTFMGYVRLARYWMVVTFSIMLALMSLYFGRVSYVLVMFTLMGMSVPFFFEGKREIWGLGLYVMGIGLLAFWYSKTPIIVQDPQEMEVFAILNLVLGIFIMMVFVGILQRENTAFENSIIRQHALLGQQKEEIEAQRDQLSEMNHEISQHNLSLHESNLTIAKKNRMIEDSIRYAKRIQAAVMPSEAELGRLFPHSFVIYKPKDIIGGDFYWAEAMGDAAFLAVADCTGHGVPGALMSMLGANLLSQIVADTQEPAQILEALDAHIRKQLRQDAAGSDIRDGMDIAVCRFDAQGLRFASAQRPVVVATTAGLQCVKGDKNPIGSGVYERKTFTTHAVPREALQAVYLYTDGCTDLFDAANRKKIGQKRWLQWLEETAALPIGRQAQDMEARIAHWAGDTPPIDDLLLLGVRVQA
jgi:serine phosphatase RsbU (regulator of sigma subunit)